MIATKDVQAFLDKWDELRSAYYKEHYPVNPTPEKLTFEAACKGKYFRICATTSCYAFIDRTNGDILFSGSWDRPSRAKSVVRGNIFAEDAMKSVGVWGVVGFRDRR